MLFLGIVLFFIIPSLSSSAQGRAQRDEAYMLTHRQFQFEVECPVYRSTLSGEQTDSQYLVAPAGSRFTLVEWKEEYGIIRFMLPPERRSVRSRLPSEEEDPFSSRYFRVYKQPFLFKARPLFRSRYALSLGNIISPVKIRIQPFDFSRDLMIGSTVGLRYQAPTSKGLSCNVLLGIGLSQNTIDSASTRGALKGVSDVLTFTPSIGFVVEFGQAQLGLFSGWDVMSRNNDYQRTWIYSRQPWIAFGIGYSIFSFQGKE